MSSMAVSYDGLIGGGGLKRASRPDIASFWRMCWCLRNFPVFSGLEENPPERCRELRVADGGEGWNIGELCVFRFVWFPERRLELVGVGKWEA